VEPYVAVKLKRKVRLEAEAGMHIVALQIDEGGLVAGGRLCRVIRNSTALATVLGGSGSKMSIEHSPTKTVEGGKNARISISCARASTLKKHSDVST
jgi:hypothetical protein